MGPPPWLGCAEVLVIRDGVRIKSRIEQCDPALVPPTYPPTDQPLFQNNSG
jgi:hypothetical protein